MKSRFLTASLAALAFVSIAQAQVIPQQTPSDTNVGGTGAAELALAELGDAAGEIKRLRNINGPSEGRDRARTEINQYPLPASKLAGLEGYYLRSSYVTLGPKGFAPLHSHANRPAYLQVVSGRIHQHRSDGQSFVMGPGDFTFSSDGLAHWWSNDYSDAPITLWIVEVCTEAHGCKEPVEGGASVLDTGDHAVTSTGNTLMAVDLAGEFEGVTGFGERQMTLRKHIVEPGHNFNPGALGPDLTYVRLFSGQLSSMQRQVQQGDVFLLEDGAVTESWVNRSDTPATLYSVHLQTRD